MMDCVGDIVCAAAADNGLVTCFVACHDLKMIRLYEWNSFGRQQT